LLYRIDEKGCTRQQTAKKDISSFGQNRHSFPVL
jgi:hypothetical protein